MIENSLPHGRHIHNKPQLDKDRAGFPGFRQIGKSGSRCTNDKKEPSREQLLSVRFPCACQCGGGGALWECAHSLLVECNCLSRIACSSPHFFSSCKAGTSFWPDFVKQYSTWGGISEYWMRLTKP